MEWSDNYLTVFTTTFQMPLFIVISGYLFSKSTKRHTYSLIAKRKVKSILVPIIIWNSLFYMPISALSLWQGWQTINEILLGYVPYIFEGLWYLWAYLLISLFMCLINSLLKNEIHRLLGYIVLIAVTHLGVGGCYHLDFMFPFFLIGYYYEKSAKRIPIKWKKVFATIACLFFPVFLSMFRPEFSMYLLGNMFEITELNYYFWACIIRFFAGVTGCVFISLTIYVLYKISHNKTITTRFSCIGKMTMELYILHTFLVSYLMRWIIDGVGIHGYFIEHSHLTNFLFAPIVVTFVLIICVGMIRIINKIPVLSGIVFGLKTKK